MEFSADAFRAVAELIAQRLEDLGGHSVQVGIPSDAKKSDTYKGITTAQLGYIHERGAPEKGLPARPFLVPGMVEAQGEIIELLGKGVKRAAQGEDITALTLNEVGLVAVNKVREQWDKNNWAPLAESTIRAKSKKLKGGNKRGRAHYKEYKKTKDVDTIRGDMQILIDTGNLRQSITYVIDSGKADSDLG